MSVSFKINSSASITNDKLNHKHIFFCSDRSPKRCDVMCVCVCACVGVSKESRGVLGHASKQAQKQVCKQAGIQASRHASIWRALSRSHALEGLVILDKIR